MTQTAAELATAYFENWRRREFDALGALFTEDVDFVGPMGTAHGVQECLGGLRGVRGLVDDIVIDKIWSDGDDAITWFELRPADAPALPVVNWSHAENGRISRIRVTFDPRPLLAPG